MVLTDGTSSLTDQAVRDVDTWIRWTQTTSTTSSMLMNDPWPSWSAELVTTTAGTGDPWPHWIDREGSIIHVDQTGPITTTIVFRHEQSGIWSSWNRGPDIIVRRNLDHIAGQPYTDGRYAEVQAEARRRRERDAFMRDEARRLAAETPEARAERERCEAAAIASAEEWKRKHDEERRLRKIAEDKAERLLESVLSPEQRDEFKRLSSFRVHTPGGNTYRIHRGWAGNLKRVEVDGQDREKVVESLCIHPANGKIPDCDNLVAQLMLLRTNEEQLRSVANISSYR